MPPKGSRRLGAAPIRLEVVVAGSNLLVPFTDTERRSIEEALARSTVRATGASEWARDVLLSAAASLRPGFVRGKKLQASIDLFEEVDALERSAIIAALARTGHNQTEAARLLRVSRRSLIAKREKFGLKPRPTRGRANARSNDRRAR